MDSKWLITVVTVVFNAEEEIEDTLSSVFNQMGLSFEYIIVDGASTDSTNTIIRRMIGSCKNTDISIKYISQRDNGIYDAMNKAVNMAKGKYVLHINSGDRLINCNILKKASSYIVSHADKHFIYGDIIYEKDGWYKKGHEDDLNCIVDYMFISHQAIFIDRNELIKHPYKEHYRICADYYFVLERFLNAGADAFCYIPLSVAISSFGGISTTHVTETAVETLELRKELGVISEQEYDAEMKSLSLISNKRHPLNELAQKLVPLQLRIKRGNKKRVEYNKKNGWTKSIGECENNN